MELFFIRIRKVKRMGGEISRAGGHVLFLETVANGRGDQVVSNHDK